MADLTAVVDEGLGNSSYLLDLGEGRALAVDPPRDLRAVRAEAQRRRLRIGFVADTHLHADFLSGAVQLAHDDGAVVLASTAGHREFPHRGLEDGDEVNLGGLILQAMSTPGHTDEHLAYVVRDGDSPLGVFTGGSLIVGSAARTDLLGPERAQPLARAQYASLQRLTSLPAQTAVWPTHGAGSFCAAPPGAARTSTIGREVATNPLLRAGDPDGFVAELLGSLGSYPPYFLRLGEANRVGPAVLDTSSTGRLRGLTVSEVQALQTQGATVIDVRPVPDYAAAHVPASVSVPLRAQFATWLGWLTQPETPLLVVRNDDQDAAEVVWQAVKIGYDRLAGELAGGIGAWTAGGQATAHTELVTADQIGDRQIIDVRQLAEFTDGHLPGARHIELGEVDSATDQVAAVPTVVMCGHGERACGAASMLERVGYRDIAVLAAGPEDWATVTGGVLVAGGP